MMPFSMMNTRWQSFRAVLTFCSTSRTETPDSLMRWISRRMSDTSFGMTPSVGSSKMISFGFIIRQRDREHLLLPAGQGAAKLARALLQARKALQHARLDLQVGLAGQAD